MKLSLIALLLPILASAASFDANVDNEESGEDEIFLVPHQVDIWEYVPDKSEFVEYGSSVVLEQPSSISWSILSFLGSFLTSPASPIKKSDSNPGIGSHETVLKESDVALIASILNCDEAIVRGLEITSLQRVPSFKGMKKFAILSHLTELGDEQLFEVFFEANLATILTEITSSREFHTVVFNCIKIKSFNSFFNAMHNRGRKYALNAPQAVIIASMVGCEEILQFVLNQQESSDFLWEWKSFDGGDGFMLNFGNTPLSAALFTGGVKAMSGGHMNCFNLLINKGLDVTFNDFSILKEAAANSNIEFFHTLFYTVSNIPSSTLREILLIAISHNNENLVENLLKSKLKLNLQVHEHLSAALSSRNERIVNLILSSVNLDGIDSKILMQAASVGNENNFIALLKVAKPDVILSSLCNCIFNTNYNHFVPRIIAEIELSPEMISLALVHAVRVSSIDFVRAFLEHKSCNGVSVKAGFSEALNSNDAQVLNQFFTFTKFNQSSLIRPRDISSALDVMFELKAWRTLRLFIEKFYTLPEFPKHKFVAMILETDQVDIVKFIAQHGAPFSKTLLAQVTNSEIHEFVSKILTANDKNKMTKSQKL